MSEGLAIGGYRLIKRIGAGGMGEVWLAEHTMLGRRAAVKLLHSTFSTRADVVTRFFNEARAATSIADPGIVQIFDFGHHTDGTAYIVMEMLDGEPLDRRLSRLRVLGSMDALRLMRQIASTLGAAHARGIVHRDLKPENIFIVRDPEVAGGERTKILDFGIAKLASDQRNLKTQTSAMMGTPLYMSPEQCRGAGLVDQRSDVYSLGCVLFQLVTGSVPFDSEGAGDIIAMHLREHAPAPSTRMPGVPPQVDALVLRCLAKDPAERFADGTELAAAIHHLLEQISVVGPATSYVVTTGGLASARTTLSSATGAMATPSPSAPHRRSRLTIGAIVAVLGIAIVMVVAVSGRSAKNNTTVPSSAAAARPTPPLTPSVVAPSSPPPVVAPSSPPLVVAPSSPPLVVAPASTPPLVSSAPTTEPATPPVDSNSPPRPTSTTKKSKRGHAAAPKPLTAPKPPANGAYLDTDGDGIPDQR